MYETTNLVLSFNRHHACTAFFWDPRLKEKDLQKRCLVKSLRISQMFRGTE